MNINFTTLLSLFRQRVEFEPIDPLGDGLGDAIAAERNEPQAITLNDFDDDTGQFWHAIENDIHTGDLVSFDEE